MSSFRRRNEPTGAPTAPLATATADRNAIRRPWANRPYFRRFARRGAVMTFSKASFSKPPFVDITSQDDILQSCLVGAGEKSTIRLTNQTNDTSKHEFNRLWPPFLMEHSASIRHVTLSVHKLRLRLQEGIGTNRHVVDFNQSRFATAKTLWSFGAMRRCLACRHAQMVDAASGPRPEAGNRIGWRGFLPNTSR